MTLAIDNGLRFFIENDGIYRRWSRSGLSKNIIAEGLLLVSLKLYNGVNLKLFFTFYNMHQII